MLIFYSGFFTWISKKIRYWNYFHLSPQTTASVLYVYIITNVVWNLQTWHVALLLSHQFHKHGCKRNQIQTLTNPRLSVCYSNQPITLPQKNILPITKHKQCYNTFISATKTFNFQKKITSNWEAIISTATSRLKWGL